MGPRHRQNVPAGKDVLGQPLRSRHERQVAIQYRFHQRVAARDDIADHPQVRLQCDLLGSIAFNEFDAGGGELVAHRRVDVRVAPRYPMPCGQRKLRQAAHERAADAQDVDMHGSSNEEEV